MTRRRVPFIINLITIVIILAIIVLIGISVLNNTVENQISKQFDSFLSSVGIADSQGYDEIESDAVNGKISMKGVNLDLEEQNLTLKADELQIIVIPSEVVSMAVNKKSGAISQAQVMGEMVEVIVPDSDVSTKMSSMDLTVYGEVGQAQLSSGDVNITGADGTMTDLAILSEELGIDTTCETLNFNTTGDFSQKSLSSNSASIREAQVSIENITSKTGNGITTKIGTLEAKVSGDVSQELMEGDLSVLFKKPNSVQLSMKDSVISVDPTAISEVDMMGFESMLGGFLQDVAIEDLTIDMETTPESVNIKSMEVTSDILTGSGNFLANFDDAFLMEEVTLSLDVESLNPEISSMISPFLALMGNPIPQDEPFTFNYSMDAEGVMKLLIE